MPNCNCNTTTGDKDHTKGVGWGVGSWASKRKITGSGVGSGVDLGVGLENTFKTSSLCLAIARPVGQSHVVSSCKFSHSCYCYWSSPCQSSLTDFQNFSSSCLFPAPSLSLATVLLLSRSRRWQYLKCTVNGLNRVLGPGLNRVWVGRLPSIPTEPIR